MLHSSIFLLPKAKETHFKQLSFILTQVPIFLTKHNFSDESSIEIPQEPLDRKIKQTQNDPSSLHFSGIVNSVTSKCSHLQYADKGEFFTNHSLKDFIFRLSHIAPDIIRSFWRASSLSPTNVLEIFHGFESYSGTYEIEVKMVENLWGIFKWASEQSREYEHLPQSCKIMASMLVRVGLHTEAEHVLSKRESRGILLDCKEIFSNLIEKYLENFELDRAVSVYERMKELSLVPSSTSYESLLKYSVELNEIQLLYPVYMDVLKIGMIGSLGDKSIHEKVIRLLCIDGKVQEARDIVRSVRKFGIEPSNLVVKAISFGYCEQKNYDDILGFFAEVETAPDIVVGNKILFSLCSSFGVEEASFFMQKLEELGFNPDEITFGIFIGCSCREGNVRDAFLYVSDGLSRGLKPHVFSYNALLSGILREGMWMHAQDLLDEMNDMGVTPNLSTFKILLAGFCKARQFDEVKGVIDQMENQGLVKLSSVEDPVSKAFILLGLDPMTVKIKRDNDKGFPKSEFFDRLGNGFYLDTDLDEYEKRITDVLDKAMIPGFNYSILENSHDRDVQSTLNMIDDMERWGQEICLSTFSLLLPRISIFPSGIIIINRLLDVMFKSVYHHDQKSLNMLVQAYSKSGLTFKARSVVEGMVRRGQIIDDTALSTLLFDLCKKCDKRSLHYFCRLAQKFKWSPDVKTGNMVLGYLCENRLLTLALKLLETMIFDDPCNKLDIFRLFLGELCSNGFTSIAYALLEEYSNQATVLDPMVHSHILQGFCKEKSFGDALRISDIFLSKNLAPPLAASIQLIPQLCKTNAIEKAVALKDACLKEQPSAFRPLRCALVKGFAKFGMVGEAARFLMDTISISLGTEDIEVFNALIEGYCRAKNPKKVEELLGFMIRNKLALSSSSYSFIVGLLCTEGKPSHALRFKELVLQVAEFPELVLYNILIFHLFKTRNILLVDEVIDVLQKKRLEFDEVTYNRVVQGFLSCNVIPRSLQYLTIMIGKNIKPSNRSLRKSISCFLCCKEELDRALSLSREMESRGWMHGSVIQNNIVGALLDRGRIQEAVAFLDRMELKDLTPYNIQYDYLIKQFYKHGRLDISVHLLNTMLRKGKRPDSTSYDYVIQGFCNVHDLNTALDFHTEMMYGGLKPSTVSWDVLVRSLCEEDRVGEAERVLKAMIESGETPIKEMFLCVIDGYRFRSNVDKASEVLKLMQEKGYEPDFQRHWSMIRNLNDSNEKDFGNRKGSFLSRLLSDIGFTRKKSQV